MKTIIHSLQQNSSWSFGLVVAVALLTMTPLMHVQVAHAQYCDPSTDPFGCDGSGSGSSGGSSGYSDPYSGSGGSSGYSDPYSGSGISWDNTWGNPYGVTNVGDPYNTVYDPSGISNGYVDYGNCGTGCGSGYNNYGGYNYTTPTYIPYTPSTYYQPPVYQQPVYQQPVYQQPVYQQPVYQQPVYQQPVYQQPVYTPPPTITSCPSGESFQNGVCSTPAVASCPPGEMFTNGVCNTPTVASCPSGESFQNGVCSSPTVSVASPVYQPPVYQPPVYQPPVYQPPVYQPPVYQQPITYVPPASQAPYVSLSQVPYTGLDLGPVGTVVYWTLLVLLCLIGAYLIAVKRIQNRFASWLKVFFFGTKKTSTVATTKTAQLASSVIIPVPDATVDDFIFKQIHRARA